MAKLAGTELRENDQPAVVSRDSVERGAVIFYSEKGELNAAQLITTTKQFREEYGNPVPGRDGMYHAMIMIDQAPVYCCRTGDADDLPLYSGAKFIDEGATAVNEAFAAGIADPDTYTFGADECMIITAKDPGDWGSSTRILLVHDESDAEVFIIQVYAPDSNGNYVQVGGDFECSRNSLKKDGFGKSMYVEDVINDISKYIYVKDNTAIAESVLPKEQTSQLQLAGGDNGSEPSAADIANAWDDYFSNKRDIRFTIAVAGGWDDPVVANKLSEICGNRQDCDAVLDCENSQDASTIVASRNAWSLTDPSYVHAYGPYLRFRDTINDKVIELAPSGLIASRFLRKNTRGRKFDPLFGKNEFSIMGSTSAGTVLGPVINFDEANQQLLTDAWINPIVNEPGVGTYVWGGYTLQTYLSARSWANVREQLNEDEQAMIGFLENYIGKNNNAFNRLRVKSSLESYLEDLVGDDNAYYSAEVVCDLTNNTEGDTTLYVDVYVAPVQPINNILLQVTITQAGVSITEVAA